ncbi:MAG: hypothetical protein VB051_11045 [Candidatus Pelethousia sp.]|nr:hypothetical protein [Candidatus Pelethousia sp.]
MVKSKTIIRSSLFPAPESEVFARLKALKTLQYIAAPYATFAPVVGNDSLVWRAGEVFAFRFKLFGFLPFGIHTIRVLEFGEGVHGIYTNESNPHVPTWNHRIMLEAIDEATTRYTDEVEIQAGWKTPLVCLWAKCFYAHRQRKWRKLLQKQNGGYDYDR